MIIDHNVASICVEQININDPTHIVIDSNLSCSISRPRPTPLELLQNDKIVYHRIFLCFLNHGLELAGLCRIETDQYVMELQF